MTRFPLSDAAWQSLATSLRLSHRELDIVQGIFDGGTEASIAGALNLSSHTVHSYLDRLYKKLRVGNRCALAVRVFAEYLGTESRDGPTCGEVHERSITDRRLATHPASHHTAEAVQLAPE